MTTAPDAAPEDESYEIRFLEGSGYRAIDVTSRAQWLLSPSEASEFKRHECLVSIEETGGALDCRKYRVVAEVLAGDGRRSGQRHFEQITVSGTSRAGVYAAYQRYGDEAIVRVSKRLLESLGCSPASNIRPEGHDANGSPVP